MDGVKEMSAFRIARRASERETERERGREGESVITKKCNKLTMVIQSDEEIDIGASSSEGSLLYLNHNQQR